eukprot:15440214-Alexandrium_andersonii.AAC.1
MHGSAGGQGLGHGAWRPVCLMDAPGARWPAFAVKLSRSLTFTRLHTVSAATAWLEFSHSSPVRLCATSRPPAVSAVCSFYFFRPGFQSSSPSADARDHWPVHALPPLIPHASPPAIASSSVPLPVWDLSWSSPTRHFALFGPPSSFGDMLRVKLIKLLRT